MAIFYPTLEQIKNDTMEKHTEGELSLLNELRSLPDDFNVYFQPHINYAHPDVIVEREGCGVLIIEVKDWDLNAYSYFKDSPEDKFGYMKVLNNANVKLSTPFDQVNQYKDDLIKNLSYELCMSLSLDQKCYRVVKTCVYFTISNKHIVESKFACSKNPFSTRYDQWCYLKFTTVLTSEDRNSIAVKIQSMLQNDPLYTPSMHKSVTALLKPSWEWLEQTSPIQLTDEQNRFAQYNPGERRRILGTPGAGKTIIIAQKAINCYHKTHSPVLILSFNITIKNYIRDKIAVNARNMSGYERSNAFERVHFDRFLPLLIRKYELMPPDINDFILSDGKFDSDGYRAEQMRIIIAAKDKIVPYKTVLIDEAQDFQDEWFQFIYNLFVSTDTDYLIVADEKQNVYLRALDDQRLPKVSGFRGPWAKIKGNHRMTKAGYHLAVAFQQEFMSEKYTIDEQVQLDLFSIFETRTYIHVSQFDPDIIFSKVHAFMRADDPISPNDICILTFENEDVREIDSCIRSHLGNESTLTVTEKKEEYIKLRNKHKVDERGLSTEEQNKRINKLNSELEKLRRTKREAFNMNSGTIKISTIYSFKGWEINTVILVIHGNKADQKPELIYTAITRTKGNLLIIGCGDNAYQDFFSRELGEINN